MADTIQTAIYRMKVEGKEAVDAAARSVDGLAVSEEKATRATRASEQGFERLMGRLDPAIRAHQQYERTLEQIARYEAAGIGTAQQRGQAIGIATARYQNAIRALNGAAGANDNLSKTTGLAAYQVQNLGFQINDIASGLAMGQSPFTILAQQGGQVYQILSMAEGGVGGALRGLKDQILGLLTPGRLLVLGFTAAAAAAYGFYRLFRTEAPTVEKTLEEQERLVGLLKSAYSDAGNSVAKFNAQVSSGLILQAQQNLLTLQNQLRDMARDAEKRFTTPTSVPSEIPAVPGVPQIESGQVISREYAAYRTALEAFFASIDKGAPQAEAALIALDKAIGDLGRSDPAIAAKGVEILERFRPLLDQAARIKELRDAMAPTPKTINAYDQLIQRTKDRIAELEMEGKVAGETSSAVSALRLQHEAERAAKQAGVAVNQKVIDQLKEQLVLAERAKAIGAVRAEIEFDRRTLGLSDAEAQIASRLRPIYGNDVAAALNSTLAAQLRVNDQLRLGRDLATDFASGFARDLRQSGDALDALGNALGRLADRLLDMAINNLVGQAFAGLTPGLGGPAAAVPGLFGLFDVGGYTGNAPRHKVAGVVHGQEFVVNAEATARHRPLLQAINDNRVPGFADGGYVGAGSAAAPLYQDNRSFAVDARGATPDAVALAFKEIRKLRAEVPQLSVAAVSKSNTVRPGAAR